MDPLKLGSHSEVPDSLEKGCLATQACQPCAAQPLPVHPRRSLIRRPWITFAIAALIWLVFSFGRRAFWDVRPHVWSWTDDRVGPPPPPNDDVEKCVGSTNWTIYYDQPPWTPEHPYGAETTFFLPLDSDALFLISRGTLQGGLVNIEQSTRVADTVDVRVRVAYFDDAALELASVCQIKRADGEYGVGIFTPGWRPHLPPYGAKAELDFDVTLTLPTGKKGPLSVKKLETMMPNYVQNVADLEESAVFDQIYLTSANGGISVQSVTSEVGQFSSLNGDIEGNFNARTFLDLHTANGHITPTVNLSHREGADPSSLVIRSINGQIDAEIALISEALIGGEFAVDAQSRNGEISLKFIDSPVDSDLQCQAETTVGGVQVELDSAFEGTYSLENVLRPKFVSQHEVEDPAERGRRRVVSVDEVPGRVVGEVRWVEKDGSSSGSAGHVALKTVFSPVKLVV